MDTLPRALTIAGSDSGGGAGIQADLKTFTALQVYGMSALTAVTAQNTVGVQQVHLLPADLVVEQIYSVCDDIGVDAAKTGMLGDRAIVEAVAVAVRDHHVPHLVVDPVMMSKGGDPLLQPDAQTALRRHLLPLYTLYETPVAYVHPDTGNIDLVDFEMEYPNRHYYKRWRGRLVWLGVGVTIGWLLSFLSKAG